MNCLLLKLPSFDDEGKYWLKINQTMKVGSFLLKDESISLRMPIRWVLDANNGLFAMGIWCGVQMYVCM